MTLNLRSRIASCVLNATKRPAACVREPGLRTVMYNKLYRFASLAATRCDLCTELCRINNYRLYGNVNRTRPL